MFSCVVGTKGGGGCREQRYDDCALRSSIVPGMSLCVLTPTRSCRDNLPSIPLFAFIHFTYIRTSDDLPPLKRKEEDDETLVGERSGGDISNASPVEPASWKNAARAFTEVAQEQVKQSFPLNGRHLPLRAGPTAHTLVHALAERPTVVLRCNMLGSLYTD